MHGHLDVKLVHLVGFIIRIYHDARSPGRQISASGWFYYKNLSRCTVTWTSNPSAGHCAAHDSDIPVQTAMGSRASYLAREHTVSQSVVHLVIN